MIVWQAAQWSALLQSDSLVFFTASPVNFVLCLERAQACEGREKRVTSTVQTKSSVRASSCGDFY